MTSVDASGLVEFNFYRPGATEVKVVGSFNQWDAVGTEMFSDGNGWWRTTVDLVAGEYRFRYVADGNWFTDFAANGVEFTKRGWNSILTVPQQSLQPSMQIRPATEPDSSEFVLDQNTTEALAA